MTLVLNGTYTAQNQELLTTILREEWDAKILLCLIGLVEEDAVAMVKAGNNLIMPGIFQ